MRRFSQRCRAGALRVAFVPTMGSLHAGHLSLVARARRRVGSRGVVVVSVYVNPTQFGPAEDYTRYPRDLARDQQLCRRAGVDVLFVPSDAKMYPGRERGDYSTYVVEERLSARMEGASRPTHFRGVTTIVAKLFHIVQPDAAVFGAKDYQQAAVVQRMVRDLGFPVQIVVAPTVREPDGLALSSRNRYLSADERRQAVVLWEALRFVRRAVKAEPVRAARLRGQVARLVRARPAARLDYVEFFDPDTLEPVTLVRPGDHMALAVYVGATRLIDNTRLV